MFLSLRANKKRIIAFLLLAAIVVAVCVFLSKKEKAPEEAFYGGTNEERIAFLSEFGWEVAENPVETREVMIPETFNDVYTAYNDMQKEQGFDLKPYAGYKCMQYKYSIMNYPDAKEIIATLLIYDDKILGGDLACAEVDGFMHGFAADSTHYGEKSAKKKDAVKEEANSRSQTGMVQSEAEKVTQEEPKEELNASTPELAENTNDAESTVADNEETAAGDVYEEISGEETLNEEVYPTD